MKEALYFLCGECGHTASKWFGKCPSCGEWNTCSEFREAPAKTKGEEKGRNTACASPAIKASETGKITCERISTGINELDRVLGGGFAAGSVVLLSGEPGIGKSTILLQLSDSVSKRRKVLYVSGEESLGQLKMRADRLGTKGDELYFCTSTDMEKIFTEADKIKPDLIIADSVQTLYEKEATGYAGSIAQIKEVSARLINYAKASGCCAVLVGHVTKDGSIAGPKILEHMVDAVLCFEGEKQLSYRIIRAEKNRYGSTNEIGVFEMTDKGLIEVENPSYVLLDEKPDGVSGSCAVCLLEGTRPIITELQALVTTSVFPNPKRNAAGMDYNRLSLILAVLEKRLGMKFSQNDVYVNVTGGLRIDDPSSDLACALALISSYSDKPVKEKTIAFGEIGLSGEVRSVSKAEMRIGEAFRLGFKNIILPERNKKALTKSFDGIEPRGVKSVYDILTMLK